MLYPNVRTIKTLLALSMATCILLFLSGCKPSANEKRIGIIIPIEHKALNEIVAGFTETLSAQSSYPLKFKIANAQGDINLQRAIIQQMRDEHYDLIAPIGTDATQMSLAVSPNQSIISLAASLSQTERAKLKSCHVAVVHDEISAEQLIHFVHLVYPQLTKLVLVHSTSDKVFPEVAAAIAAGKRYGIQIKARMVPTLNDLYSTANNIPADTTGLLVLKDSLIVSGISTLAIAAEKRHIPLITSDQGSVQEGAAFALGVHERDIGSEGAKLAASLLAGKPACDLPIIEMTRLTVFVNKATLIKEHQPLQAIQSAAKQQHYAIEFVDIAKVHGS